MLCHDLLATGSGEITKVTNFVSEDSKNKELSREAINSFQFTFLVPTPNNSLTEHLPLQSAIITILRLIGVIITLALKQVFLH